MTTARAVGATDTCPICSDASMPERYVLREMLFGSREKFLYLRCATCGALRIEEPPADLARHYPPAYYSGAAAPPRSEARTRASRPGRRRPRSACPARPGPAQARLLKRWAPPLTPEVRRASAFTRRAGLRAFDDPILDVGCGHRAVNLANLQAVGFRRLLGIDPFLDGDGSFEGIPLRRQSIHEVDGSYQVITFHHSFEHVPDPQATLTAAARRLRPGGVVLIRTPVMGGWFWERFGTDWWELDAPRHLFVHTAG